MFFLSCLSLKDSWTYQTSLVNAVTTEQSDEKVEEFYSQITTKQDLILIVGGFNAKFP